jgi:hypothetical protein
MNAEHVRADPFPARRTVEMFKRSAFTQPIVIL